LEKIDTIEKMADAGDLELAHKQLGALRNTLRQYKAAAAGAGAEKSERLF